MSTSEYSKELRNAQYKLPHVKKRILKAVKVYNAKNKDKILAKKKERMKDPIVSKRMRTYQENYSKDPKIIARKREYSKTDEFKKRNKKWRFKPENLKRIKDYSKEYSQRPEVKLKLKAKTSTPEFKAKTLAYRNANRERLNAAAREAYKRKMAPILASRPKKVLKAKTLISYKWKARQLRLETDPVYKYKFLVRALYSSFKCCYNQPIYAKKHGQKQSVKDYRKQWRLENRDKVKAYAKKHSSSESVKEYRLDWHKKKYKNDPNYRKRVVEGVRKYREKNKANYAIYSLFVYAAKRDDRY